MVSNNKLSIIDLKSLFLAPLLVALLLMSACGDSKDCVGDECEEPISCVTNEECPEGRYCSDFECLPDPCTEDLCERGVCERGSSECVSKEYCDQDTADEDCIEGEQCVVSTCMNEEMYCQSNVCDRGVCDFDARGCVSAENCEGDSNNCLEGEFCNLDDECAEDPCLGDEIVCDDGGVCDPNSGECVEPGNCNSSDDCLDGSTCVFDKERSESVCLPDSKICGNGSGDSGCTGNQICNYDESLLTAECEESGTCRNALDCLAERYCEGSACAAARTCEDDEFEPNDDVDNATNLLRHASNGTLHASICEQDVDYYALNVEELAAGEEDGVLMVSLQYKSQDVGLGEVELQVNNPDGDNLFSGSTGSLGIDGGVEALVELDEIHEGDYILQVKARDDMTRNGVDYTLSVSFASREIQEACMGAIPVEVNGPSVSGDTSQAESGVLGASCIGSDTSAPEVVFSFELTERSIVSAIVIPRSDNSKLSASIRKSCAIADSEVACQNDVEDGRNPMNPSLEPGVYYVIVQARDGGEGGEFNLGVSSSPVACTQADNACVDEDTVQRCNLDTHELETQNCISGCDADIADCRRPPGDLCAQAVEEDEPFSETFNWSDYRNDLEVASGGCVPTENSQGNTETDGPDRVWKITIPANKALDATLTTAQGEQGSIYVLSGCGDPAGTCLEGQNSGNVRDQHIGWVNASDDPLVVYLVADRSASGNMGEATMVVDFVDVICDPADEAYCNDDEDIEKCNKWGTGYEVARACNFGCEDATCSPPTNDSCSEPLALENGMTVQANISDYSNQHTTTCFSTTARGNGRDAVYKITTTLANTKVKVTMYSEFDGVLYASATCPSGDVSQCEDRADSYTSNNTETIEFEAEDPGDYFIFADAYFSSDSSGEFELTVTLDEPSCTPGEVLGCEGNSVETCDSKGFPQTSACRSTCEDGACYNAPGELCDDALPLASGDTVTGDIGDFYPDYFLSADSCTGNTTRGPDVVYALETTAPNQIVELNLDADFDAVLYVSRDCVATGGAPTCVAGADENGNNSGEDLTFLAVEEGLYYIYVDSYSTTASGDFSLTADVRAPSCSPGEILGCSGDQLSYCNSLGDPTDYDCDGGCQNGVCAQPSGDVCHDPIVLNDGDTVVDTVNASGRTDSIRLTSGVHNQCIVGSNSTRGQENIYRVDLNAGELLTVDITSDATSLVPYISRSCVSASQTCQAIDSNGKDGKLQYFADASESVFVVVDASSTTPAEYNLAVGIDSNHACAPGSFRCLDSDTLQICNRDGSEILGEYDCPDGCSAGSCKGIESPSDCSDSHSIGGINAPNIGTGISVHAKFSDLSNHVSMPASGCTGVAGSGPDMIFAVDLSPGDVLEGRVISPTGEDPSVYILQDCGSASSCVAGGAAEEGLNVAQEAYVRYLAETSETVYIVADSRSSSAKDPFRFDVNVSPAECGSSDTSCVDSETEKFCNAGLFDEHRCYYGPCTGGATGSCEGGAPDLCADAMVIPNDGQEHVFRGLLQDLTNVADLGRAAAHSTCDGNGSTAGPDAFYAIDLAIGDILRVKYTSPGDPVLWVTNSCSGNLANKCFDTYVATSSNADEALAEFVAPASGTYYLVADNADTNVVEGEYSLEAQVVQPECTPYATECKDGSTMRQCSRNGVWAEVSCYYGCENDECAEVRGDTCDDAIEVPNAYGSYTFNGLMEDYTDTVNLSSRSESCDGRSMTAGPEVFYSVEMAEGDILHVEWTSSGDGVLWIADDCDAHVYNACVAAVDSGNPETIDFVAPADGTYFIVGDNYSSYTTSGEFTMEIELREPDCIPSSYAQTCLSDNTLQYCTSLGEIDERECACVDDTCLEGGDTCQDAPDITANASEPGGARFSGSYGEYENSFEGNYCGETSYYNKGQDIVYKLHLDEDQVLKVSVQNTSAAYASLYLVEDCDDLQANSCVASSPSRSSSSNTLTYTATESKDYYLIADHDYPIANPDYDIHIEITEACDASTFDATCVSNTLLEYCDSDSVVTTRACLCENDTCLDGGETCDDAPNVTNAAAQEGGVSFQGAYADFTNDYEGNYCGGDSGDTRGQDFVYLVDLVQGEKINVRVQSSSLAYPSIFFVNSCEDMVADECLDASIAAGSGTNTGSYTATRNGSIYVVIDHDWPSGSNTYTVDLEIE